jgi:hypothetical protein
MPSRRYAPPSQTQVPPGGHFVHRGYTVIRSLARDEWYIIKDKTNIGVARTELGAREMIDGLFPKRNTMATRKVTKRRRRSARQVGSRRNPLPRGKSLRTGSFKDTLTVIRAGGFVEQIKYSDANDRQRYFHDFEDLGAQLFLCDSVAFGKCILVVSSDEKPLWEPA